MKVLNLVMVVGLIVSGNAVAKTYKIDQKASKLSWVGTKVIGDKHTGTLEIKKGEITYKAGKPASAKVVVDMATIRNLDLKDQEWNKKLVDHLHSDDFFGTKKYPEATIVISKFNLQKDKTYKLNGDLTIKGITKPVTITATIKESKKLADRIMANLEFDRTEFNIRYGSGKFFENLGDKMISDKIQVQVDLKLRQPIVIGQN